MAGERQNSFDERVKTIVLAIVSPALAEITEEWQSIKNEWEKYRKASAAANVNAMIQIIAKEEMNKVNRLNGEELVKKRKQCEQLLQKAENLGEDLQYKLQQADVLVQDFSHISTSLKEVMGK